MLFGQVLHPLEEVLVPQQVGLEDDLADDSLCLLFVLQLHLVYDLLHEHIGLPFLLERLNNLF